MQYINNQSTSSTAAWLYPKINIKMWLDMIHILKGSGYSETGQWQHVIDFKSSCMLFALQPLYYLFLLCAIYSRGRCSKSRPTSCPSNRSMCKYNAVLTPCVSEIPSMAKTFCVSSKGDALHQTSGHDAWPCVRNDDRGPITGGMTDDDRLG